ncbi:MAG: ATP-binding protein [Sulfurovum sp.]|nr:ATP-binding protein [Sulfurovum sp.]MCB4746428.1 ATP-binding protein [Sulfurovum sp.]MCB4748207.1 ATP-binding protein [Sulfurovum sp.]MCB4748778.1 ATP-binding protein [Sulfurovum sp.]MCB4752522.1 ATP-binding protein [Sulfurovum sp.]
MATAEQIKSLIKSHYSDDLERFRTVALQVAAHEARKGHGALALDLRDILNKEQRKVKQSISFLPSELEGLVLVEQTSITQSSLVMNANLKNRITRILTEYRQKNKLKSHGLDCRRKILLSGAPGTGKTMTAKVLAKELHLPLYTIQVDRLVTKFMGETSAKLRQIFDLIKEKPGVYLFDEFDAIGSERTLDNDVGEMRRVLNAFLQFIEQDTSDSLIIAATNHPRLLDHALFRRFDDVLYYDYPKEEERKHLIENLLGTFKAVRFEWKSVLKKSEGLSHAEIDHACRDAIKHTILSDQTKVNATLLLQMIKERKKNHLA